VPYCNIHHLKLPPLQSDDEEAAQEEEEEALRLQREQQAALRPEDYDDSALFPHAPGGAASSSEEEEESDAEEPTLGAAAAQVTFTLFLKQALLRGALQWPTASSVQGEVIRRCEQKYDAEGGKRCHRQAANSKVTWSASGATAA